MISYFERHSLFLKIVAGAVVMAALLNYRVGKVEEVISATKNTIDSQYVRKDVLEQQLLRIEQSIRRIETDLSKQPAR